MAKNDGYPDDDPPIPDDYIGWWRIIETSQWATEHLDLIGPAMLSIFERGGQWRMIALLADVEWIATKTGVRFVLTGSWEYDPTVATGSVKLGKDGRLKGTFKIKQGDSSTFIAERTETPSRPIPPPPRAIRARVPAGRAHIALQARLQDGEVRPQAASHSRG